MIIKIAEKLSLLARPASLRIVVTASVAAVGISNAARAENITFSVIGAQEYNLPVDYTPFNAFVQYNELNVTSQQLNYSGKIIAAPRQSLYVGLSKYVRFFTIEGIPHVGFALEAIATEVQSSSALSHENKGFGDPFFGAAAWIKPTSNSTFGFQTFLTTPIGSSAVSNHYFANYSSLFYDYEGKLFDLSGDTGVIFRTDEQGPGIITQSESAVFHNNLRFGIKTGTVFEPYAAVDFQANGSNINRSTGYVIPNSRSYDLAAGGGFRMVLTDKINISFHYLRSVTGVNTPLTEGSYLKFVAIF